MHSAAEPKPLATLLVVLGPDQGKSLQLRPGTYRIGRDRHSHLQLRDTEVSRKHALLEVSEQGMWIEDVGSSNGTFVNGERVDRRELRPGDRIRMGRSVLVLTAVENEGATASAARVDLVTGNPAVERSAIVHRLPPQPVSTQLLGSDALQSGELGAALAHLRILFEASQAVSRILEIPDLLHRILELALRSVPAERGVALLRREGEEECAPVAVVTRGRDGDENIRISRTIIDYVLRHHEGVLTSDARKDTRFFGGASIQQFAIREAICVPMEGRHEVVGVLYLDRRASVAQQITSDRIATDFTAEHLQLALAVGRIAALAVEETQYYQALLRAERLAAVGQAMAALSHHIKNILQGLRTGGDLIEMGLDRHDERFLRQGWQIVNRNQSRMYHLVMDMLSYSKDRTPLWEPVVLAELVRDVAELLQSRADESGVQFYVEAPQEEVKFFADPQGIHQAVLNLGLNAIDAVREVDDGKVWLVVRTVPEERTLVIEVRDNGPGVPPELQQKIFSPFFSTKGSRGTGLGLAVTEKIVREHEGRVELDSQPGQGAVFRIVLPLRSEPPAVTSGEDSSAIPTLS